MAAKPREGDLSENELCQQPLVEVRQTHAHERNEAAAREATANNL